VWTWLALCFASARHVAGAWVCSRPLTTVPAFSRDLRDLFSNPQLLALAEEAAGFGIWEADLVNRVIHLSPGAARLSGYQAVATRVATAELLELIHPDDREAADAASNMAIAQRTDFLSEFRVRQPDGSYRWRRNRGRMDSAGGRSARMVGAISDIHDEKVMLEQLGQAADRMALAEDAAGFGVWELDVTSGCMTLSAGAAALSGFERRSMQASAEEITSRIHPDDVLHVGVVIERAVREGKPYSVDCRVKLADGELRWIRSQADVETREGKTVRVTGAIIDVTRERVLLDQLRQSAERMRLAEEAAGFGVWESDRVTRSVTFSEGVLRLAGLPADAPQTYASRDLVGIFDPDHLAAVKAATDVSFETNQPFEKEIPLSSRNGTTRWCRVRARPEYLNGEPWRVIGATLDITDERQMRLSLEQARANAEEGARAKSEFLANMSHEIRTPLNGVMGMTQLLLDSPLTPQQRDWAETAMGSGTTLLSIIDDILDFSKIEAGKLAIDVLAFDLRRVLEEVAALLAPKAASKGIDLIVRYDPATPAYLVGDAQRIRQVVTNLANNAIKFTETGHVLITAEALEHDAVGATVRIAVADTGIGIPSHAVPTLFDKFTQADSSTTRRFGGTGLGLAISKRLVELMRGTLGVDSEEGRGSTFEFTLRLPLGNHPDTVIPTSVASLRGVRTLIVTDNVVNRRVIREHILSFGMRDGSCATGHEAIETVRAAQSAGDPYEIIIADQAAPDVDGTPLAAALREQRGCRNLTYVMLTSVSSPIDEKKLLELGVDAWLVKPIRQERLISTLSTAWSRRGAASPQEEAAPQPSKSPVNTIVGSSRFSARVLVVEDNVVNKKVAVALLGRLGVRVDVAANGEEALAHVQARRYDLILMDCQMPVMNGYDATAEIRRLKTDAARVPIIAMTADVIESSKDRARQAGMDDFVAKPVDIRALSRVLQTWLKRAA
jgi:two-component system sensor histidine kinase/response regulator